MPLPSPRRRLGILVAIALICLLPAAAGARQGPPAGVHLAGTTQLASLTSPTVLNDTGTVKGSPIGSGSIALTYTLHPRRGVARTTFTITNDRGTVSGVAASTYEQTRLHLTFSGAGIVTAGTGAYAGITSGLLQFNAVHSITGKREAIRLSGAIARPSAAPSRALFKAYLASLGFRTTTLRTRLVAMPVQEASLRTGMTSRAAVLRSFRDPHFGH